MKANEDAFGHAMLDYVQGKNVGEAAAFGCKTWFSEYGEWFEREKKAIAHAQGRVLDVGCGAGRHSLYLQQRGHDVLAIDNSPLAMRVCRQRGVKNTRALSITRISAKLGVFDTILMLGNNFGLMGNCRRGRWLLRRFKAMTPAEGIIIAGDGDLAANGDPETQARVRRNVARGKMPGEIRLRPRYRDYVSPPMTWLYASKEDMVHVLDGTGWAVREFFDDIPPSGAYAAVIEKT